jgi:hypothetical protein
MKMSDVIVRLKGGLGNQMFQYAAGLALAERLGTRLSLDCSRIGIDPDRKFALAPFGISAKEQSHNAMSERNGYLIKYISKWIPRTIDIFNPKIFFESSFRYDMAFERIKKPLILEGYFQSERYFSPISKLIANTFVVREEASKQARDLLDEIKMNESICVHIRRGDYISNPAANAFHGICSLEYYYEAISLIADNLSRPQCYIFSDDPAWVKSNFKGTVPSKLVDIHTSDQAHEDLRLMSACRYFVIANSSFSWWAAWLGSDLQKRVIYPREWFKNYSQDTTDLIPHDWLTIQP